MAGRDALIIATGTYHDRNLRRLRSPAQDATALQRVLGDPDIGGFDVWKPLIDQPWATLRERLYDFFARRLRDDVLLVHISCHGIKDDEGQLYFAAADTDPDRLEVTALPATFVREQMDECRARSIVLLLDCCYAGAFAAGSKADRGVHLKEEFAGDGRAILTASNSIEYAWEGDELIGEGGSSQFTAAVVDGLESGQADRDQDGLIAIYELHEHVTDRVLDAGHTQTPLKWELGIQGGLYIARNPNLGRGDPTPGPGGADAAEPGGSDAGSGAGAPPSGPSEPSEPSPSPEPAEPSTRDRAASRTSLRQDVWSSTAAMVVLVAVIGAVVAGVLFTSVDHSVLMGSDDDADTVAGDPDAAAGSEPDEDEPGGDEPGTEEPGPDEPGPEEPEPDESGPEEPEPEEPEPDPAPAIAGDITMARANWHTGYFQAEIYHQLLEELGYTVTDPSEHEMGAQIFYQKVNEGKVDFWANGWFPLHADYLAEAPNAERVGIQAEAGAFQGYLADKATVEAHDITSIEQIDDTPEHAELFDFDDDGVGDLVGCTSGWGCFESIEAHFSESDLGDNLTHVSGAYSALMTDTIARYERGEPVLFYTWMPNWVVAELEPGEDVVWLESSSHPDGQAPVPGDQLPGGPGACAAEPPCDVGLAVNDIQVVANHDFLHANPAAEALFERVTLSPLHISQQNARMQAGGDSRADIARHAEQWIEANRETVDGWLDAARDAAG